MQTTIDIVSQNFKKFQQVWSKSTNFRIITICFGMTGYLFTRYAYHSIKRRVCNLPPGVIGLPFIGAAADLFRREYWIQLGTTYGNIASCFLGNEYLVVFNEPKLARKYFSHPRSLIMAVPESDMTFFSTNGKEWADRRRIIFANLMSTMRATYVEFVTKKFIKNKLFPILDKDARQNKSTEVKPLFRPIGFNIVLQACFGKELSSLDDPFWLQWDKRLRDDQKYVNFRSLIGNILGQNELSYYVQRKLTGDDEKNNLVFNRGIDSLDAFAKNRKFDIVLDEEMKQNTDIKLFNDYVEDYVNAKDGAKFTRRQLLGDMALMFAAATDTTFSALAFSCLLLARYPELQYQIYEEITNAFGTNVDNIRLSDKGITKLSKLRAFIHESLRIQSPVNLSGIRRLKEDKVMVDGYHIPKDSVTMINVVAISHNPKFWIDNYDESKHGQVNMREIHLDFWMDEDGNFSKKKNGHNLFTFHYGKRDCAGQSLVMKELIIVLAMIIMQYNVKPFDGNPNFEIKAVFRGAIMEPEIRKIRFCPRA